MKFEFREIRTGEAVVGYGHVSVCRSAPIATLVTIGSSFGPPCCHSQGHRPFVRFIRVPRSSP